MRIPFLRATLRKTLRHCA
uniref:Uncharacterized protein n=1 Tax=Anguilla anguilla TaxID=7936 RepID=A0A0E9XQT7_ANGAN